MLEIKFVHRKIKSCAMNYPFEIGQWMDKDLIKITLIIDEVFKRVDSAISRSMFVETWRVYQEAS